MKILLLLKKYIFKHLSAILIVGFVVSYLFIVENNYIDICKNDAKIRTLQQNINQEESTIERLKKQIRDVKTDPATIERIAREKYGMQQPHEDVYLIVTDSSDTAIQQTRQEK